MDFFFKFKTSLIYHLIVLLSAGFWEICRKAVGVVQPVQLASEGSFQWWPQISHCQR